MPNRNKKNYRNNRIVGGVEVTNKDKYPFVVSLQINGSHFCGGSLISDKLVLSAAHCFVDTGYDISDIRVMVGTNTLNGNTAENYFNVKAVFVHKNYNSNTINNDIAIVALEESVPTSIVSKYMKYKKNPQSEINNLFTVDSPVIVSGWGVTQYQGSVPNVLREVELNVIRLDKIPSEYTTYNNTTMIAVGAIDQNYDIAGGKDSCQGDSGGPMYQLNTNDNNYYQGGIVSWGLQCALPNYPGVYARISNYISWIDSIYAVEGDPSQVDTDIVDIIESSPELDICGNPVGSGGSGFCTIL